MQVVTTYPGAILKLIPPGTNDPAIVPVGVVLHRAVSRSDSLYGYFNGPSGGIESHLYVRLDGTVEQYRDFEHEADAQLAGNSWAVGSKRFGFISIETQDLNPDGSAVPQWTEAQMVRLSDIIHWLSARYGFPPAIVNYAQPVSAASGGVGWHSKFSSWNPDAHDCPGAARIAQVPALLVQEIDVQLSDQILGRTTTQGGSTVPLTVGLALSRMYDSIGAIFHNTDGLDTTIADAVKAALAAQPTASGVDADAVAAAVVAALGKKLAA